MMYAVCQPPEFILPPESLEVIVDQPFSLACIVHGNPVPQLTWLKDDKVITVYDGNCQNEVDVESLQNFGKFVVNRADLARHDGKFSVHATNDAGEVTYKVEVTGERCTFGT